MLTLWALIVVMPDAMRIPRPLGTLGFSVDNNGYVYSVDADGPAAKAGVKVGDRVALDKMSCWRRTSECAQLLSVFGGMGGLQYVRTSASVSLWLRGPDQKPADPPRLHATIAAQPEEHGKTSTDRTLWRIALGADELGALAFILCSAWLVWRRPGTTTAGFFAYALWFNPGQYFEFYSWLQGHPVAMFAQETLQAIFQSLGYIGFLVLALYFPNNVARPRLRWIGTTLPWIFAALTGLQLASFLNIFGIGTELVTRASYIAGWSLNAAVLFYVLPAVLLDQKPEEKARTKWLLTGCVIGLSSFIFADFNEATTMSPFNISETTTNLLYFVNVMTLAVVIYTVRHHRVVNVRFALTRGLERLGMWAMVTALGAFLIHRIDEQLGKDFHWDEIAVSLALVGATLAWERVQEFAIELLDYVLFPRFRRSLEEMRSLAHRLCELKSIAHVERSLIERPAKALRISSAAVFRRHRSGLFRRCSASGWPARALSVVQPTGTLVIDYLKEEERPVRLRNARWARDLLPDGVALPTVAVPIRAFGRLHAIVLYGAHAKGDDLNGEEIEVLERLARSAALAYESIEAAALRRQVRALARLRP
ncbi:MAG: hypothetical protein NVS4B13_05250 [Candidatus Elarobacter sp.]